MEDRVVKMRLKVWDYIIIINIIAARTVWDRSLKWRSFLVTSWVAPRSGVLRQIKNARYNLIIIVYNVWLFDLEEDSIRVLIWYRL